MDPKALYTKLKHYFSNKPDLMRHLHTNACWEYNIYHNSLKEQTFKLRYYLFKKDENILKITQKKADFVPDLILYFTEEAILQLIQDNPASELYYQRYHKMMNDISKDKVDSKVNKSRFNLLRLGYQKWQKDFKF